MHYDFDTRVERRGTNALKWEVGEKELPMWVADMDFQTAPEILEALKSRVEHGVFGYEMIPEEWYQAYIRWWQDRHQFQMQKEWFIFCNGVIPAISSAVRKLTTVGDNVLVQSPVYHGFFHSIANNGRVILDSPLTYDGEQYQIDFNDLESKLAQPQTTMMILCNPHNPVGKIWSRDTLSQIGDLCQKHHVVVLSDEIHGDITDPGENYNPFASVSETCRDNSVTCIAPTKAFNLAGLQTAAVVVPNDWIRCKIERGLNTDEAAEPNAFAVTGAIAAFTQGGQWLDAFRKYSYDNKCLVKEYLEREIPNVKLISSKATYLLWLNCCRYKGGDLAGFLRRETGLYLSEGAQYGQTGEGFLRMNIACPREVLKDGLQRLKTGVLAFDKMDDTKQSEGYE